MKNITKVLALLSFFMLLALFMGAASAESLNLTETELASEGVKNYTESHSHLPGYVVVSDKNSTTPSFLKTATKTVVQLNSGSTTPVTISAVSSPSGPSGTATGNLYKADYVTVANNVYNYINTNGRAPNYASSSLGNIRYEALVYAYAKIIKFYKDNGYLPNYVSIVQYTGTDSTGVVIDNVPPTVNNNLASGTYNTLKNVTLTASDNVDSNPTVYYSLDNGATWSNKAKTVTLNLNPGLTNLKYYGRDASGNIGTTQTATYNINAELPEGVSVDDLLYAASSVKSYIEAKHELPSNITINGKTVNMAQFLKLASAASININNNVNASISLENYTVATNPSENITTNGNLNKTSYITLATNISSYMTSNGRAPDYQTISLGNLRYESLVYTFAQILSSYGVGKVLPNYIIIRPWTVVSNNSTVFVTMSQINNAADTLQSYIETNHTLPNHVTISESKVTMPQFLKLEVMYITNGYNNLYQSIPLLNYGTAPNPSESITGGDLNQTSYLSSASSISNFMDTNGLAPNYASTVRGYIRYESLVYIYAEIINSASKNGRLPDYVTLTPWTTVTNTNTVFISMDQISSAIWTVKNHIETNHALPSTVSISGRQITMPQFLRLEIMSLKNINAKLYQSIVLQSYNAPSSPSETLTEGKISSANYLNAVDSIKSFMDTNGQAPNYAWTSQGNMGYQNLIYTYSQILNYYNVKNTLPEYVTVVPWSTISNPSTVTFNVGQIISGAETVKTYIETNHAIPTNVNISGTLVTMPQFLKLLTTALHNVNGTYVGPLVLTSYGLPTDTPETVTGGVLNQTQYLDLARNVEFFMYGDRRAPNYQNSSLGNINYPSLIYTFSSILTSYKNNHILPDLITVRPWSVVSNATTKFITIDQIKDAAKTVKTYVETNHALPNNVTINGTQITMSQFLKLLTTATTNINGNLNTTIVLQNYNTATSPSETVTGGSINNTSYISLANNVISYMDSNGKGPDYSSSSIGNIRYESLIYMYSLILDYYGNKTELPQNITVNPWSVVSNSSTKFFTQNQLQDAAKTVQSYIETNHALPSSISINGTTVNMAQFLQMAAAATLNIESSLYTSIALKNYNAAPAPAETINKEGTIANSDYIRLSSDIISYMYANGQAPNNMTTNIGTMRYESLVYMYSQILGSYNATSSLAESIVINPWTTVSNSSTVFITTDQIINASQGLKAYVESNHTLPTNMTVAGRQITVPQFLKLAAKSVINIENYLYTSVILDNVGNPTNHTENITSGTILSEEFVDMATNIKSYMNSNGIAPNNLTNTSVGDVMGYESLVYMFSKIMVSYNATESAPSYVSVIPWLAVSNPNGTFNFRTQEMFSSIQAAIDDTDTVSGDFIWLQKVNYVENVVINKKITLKPISGVNVTINALNPNLPIFTINFSGNGTTIQDLIINGSTYNAGIYINGSNGNQILGNNITRNSNGICIYNATENVISGNKIFNNSISGVFVNIGSDNEISSNNIMSNSVAGINIQNSDKNRIYSNNLYSNQDGIHLNNASTDIHLNRIAGNSRYGLFNEGNGTVNATNNWWGKNNPIISSVGPSDIYVASGNVTYNPWLVLSVNISTDRSDRNSTCYKYQVSADLTHNNQGKDTSSDGNVPDDIPIYFNSTLGTVNSSATTRKGRAELQLTSSLTGTANVSAILDNQTVSQSINITSVNVLGVYNNRTQESFSNIQDAINDADTINGDTLTLAEGIYTENIVINKKITIKPVIGANVTVKYKDDDKNVFVINNGGSGSTIQGLNIISSTDDYGISMSQSFNNNIINNTISDSNKGIYLYASGNNSIIGNIVKDGYYGIISYNSTGNTISQNTIKNNENGIYLFNSNYNKINGNNLTDNYYATYFYHSNNNIINSNNLNGNWVGIYLYDTNNNNVTGNTLIENGAGITYHNSMGTAISGNNFTSNWLTDTSVVDDGEMVMASTTYTCGPAALATILKTLGIYTTEAELAKIAGTDETGTSLFGLKTAALSKGITAIGARLTIDQLQTNYLVVLDIDGTKHFEVIRNITNTTVYLFDPNLGNIELSRGKFNELYIGVAMIFNGQAPANATLLTDDEMRNIKGSWHVEKIAHTYWTPGYVYFTYRWVGIRISVPYLAFRWVPPYRLWGWLTIPGHIQPYIAWRTIRVGMWVPIPHYVPPRKVTYYTYISVPDIDLNKIYKKINPANKPWYNINISKLANTVVGIRYWRPSGGKGQYTNGLFGVDDQPWFYDRPFWDQECYIVVQLPFDCPLFHMGTQWDPYYSNMYV